MNDAKYRYKVAAEKQERHEKKLQGLIERWFHFIKNTEE